MRRPRFSDFRHSVVTTSFLFLLSISLSPFGFANEAPLGLTWGMTADELRGASIQLSESGVEGALTTFTTASLPANVSDAESYMLLVHGRLGLVKVLVLSKDFTGDLYGTAGKERYEALKATLTNRYGQPTQVLERVGMRLYDERDEFYECLRHDGCGVWTSLFTKDGMTVGISLRGLRSGVGFYRLEYESTDFSQALEERDQANAENDANAL